MSNTSDSGSSDSAFEFAGRENDTSLVPAPGGALYYMRARYYDPQIARFISRDPAGGGVNPYLYAGDSPTNFSDPTGDWVYNPGNCDSCFSGPDSIAIPHGFVGAFVPPHVAQLANFDGRDMQGRQTSGGLGDLWHRPMRRTRPATRSRLKGGRNRKSKRISMP